MKKPINLKLIPYLLSCMLLPIYGCNDDDNEAPSGVIPTEETPNLEKGGSMYAEINGEAINYPQVGIQLYGGAGVFTFGGVEHAHEDTTKILRVRLPLEPITGIFDHSDFGFNVDYEVIAGNNETGYTYNVDKVSEINVMTYDSIGFSGDTTFYNVEGTFSFSGKRQLDIDSVTVDNGEFDVVYAIWF